MARTTDIEKRSVHTDALQTLGSILGEGDRRDAIHLAVEPVIAGQDLSRGAHVGRWLDGTYANAFGSVKPLGIVDPFLVKPVLKGERFWLIVYPRQITSLRHVWSHPDFPEPDATATVITADEDHPESRQWIKEFAGRIQMGESWDSEDGNGLMLTYEELMEAAATWMRTGDLTCLGADIDYDDMQVSIPKFWHHYALVTGQEVPESKQESFFRCAC